MRRLAGWIALALAITLPWRGLLGHPEVDVWNHVWGYWWFGEELPWRTQLLGAPKGGVLWFVDPLGALAGLPLTLTLGAAAAYNAVMVARVAMAGWFADLLCEEVSGTGPHTRIAGAAYATTPFLLCELANGISEVAATWWIPAVLLAAARAFRTGAPRDWALLGAAGGLSVVGNFYYGLTTALLVGMGWIAASRSWRGALVAGAVSIVLAAPALAALRVSVRSPDALVRRSASLNMDLAAHNAVDPRVYVMPGEFWSVDLQAKYGEPFRHTGYLRWSVLGLALLALRRGHRRWGALAAVSLVLGLGPFLWWDGKWLEVGGNVFSLPFHWFQQLVPELAITHPLRLSIGAQAIACVLAGAALAGERRRSLLAVATALPVAETVFASAAIWPIPSAPTAIPSIYKEIAGSSDPRAVLDLPPEVGTGMATSRYFWFQTAHGHPVPYTPDARAGSTGDPDTFEHFRMRGGVHPFDAADVAGVRDRYGWIVLHPELEARSGRPLRSALEAAFGTPETTPEGPLVWRL